MEGYARVPYSVFKEIMEFQSRTRENVMQKEGRNKYRSVELSQE
jgi:hypothetical protein